MTERFPLIALLVGGKENMMSFLKKLFGVPTPVEIMRADLYMEYRPLTSTGAAAIEWVPIGSDDMNLRPFLVALLYARILIAHAETRTKLFEIVGAVSKESIRTEGSSGMLFPDWTLSIGSGAPEQRIWPWEFIASIHELSKPKIYSATLLAFPESKQWGINLKMALGQERILAPAAVLLTITSYVKSTDQEGCYEFAVLLWQINEYYGSPDRVSIGSETKAIAAATEAIRIGNLQAPQISGK